MRESETRPEQHLSDPGKEARRKAGIPVVPAFDGYRALAILAVVALHLTQISGLAGDGGTLGSRVIWGTLGRAVEILFIVSGFVVFLPTVARGGSFGSVRAYAIRRAARLLPAYWLMLLICLLLIGLFNLENPLIPGEPITFPGADDLLFNFSATVVPAKMFIDVLPVGFGLDPPMWTLSSELIFYIVLPLIALAFFRFPKTGLLISALITLGWALAFDNIATIANDLGAGIGLGESARLKLASYQQFPAWAFSFGLGMAGAVAWVRLSGRPRPGLNRRAGIVALVSLAAVAICALRLGADGAWIHTSLLWSTAFSASIAMLMLSLAMTRDTWQKPFTAEPVRRLGDISYGIYLVHYPLIVLVLSAIDLSGNSSLTRFLVLAAIVLPGAVLYGYLSARFLEQPIRRWARRYGRRDEG
ncbi:MAG: acyltransferase [Solirubrobacterales bacterium]|nr:acyltransferase [Solirubrobacterales bacterium]MCB0859824.1 acyltransferase [Solirubrobacterales bacterium]